MKIKVVQKIYKDIEIPFEEVLSKIFVESRTYEDKLDLYCNSGMSGYVSRFASIPMDCIKKQELQWLLNSCDETVRVDREKAVEILGKYEKDVVELSLPTLSHYGLME